MNRVSLNQAYLDMAIPMYTNIIFMYQTVKLSKTHEIGLLQDR